MRKIRNLLFTCPQCGEHRIEEIQVGMTIATEISGLAVDDDGAGAEIMYGEQTNKDGHVNRYQCRDCGYTIVDDDSVHAADGLDEYALAMAIDALNKSEMGELISHDELVSRITGIVDGSSGKELAALWNELSRDEVVYEGDSIYRMKG